MCCWKETDLTRRPLMRCYRTRNNTLNNWHLLLIVWLCTVCARRLENIIKCLHFDFCSTFNILPKLAISIALLFLVYILVHDPGLDFLVQGPECNCVRPYLTLMGLVFI